jgi:hypothetical protein
MMSRFHGRPDLDARHKRRFNDESSSSINKRLLSTGRIPVTVGSSRIPIDLGIPSERGYTGVRHPSPAASQFSSPSSMSTNSQDRCDEARTETAYPACLGVEVAQMASQPTCSSSGPSRNHTLSHPRPTLVDEGNNDESTTGLSMHTTSVRPNVHGQNGDEQILAAPRSPEPSRSRSYSLRDRPAGTIPAEAPLPSGSNGNVVTAGVGNLESVQNLTWLAGEDDKGIIIATLPEPDGAREFLVRASLHPKKILVLTKRAIDLYKKPLGYHFRAGKAEVRFEEILAFGRLLGPFSSMRSKEEVGSEMRKIGIQPASSSSHGNGQGSMVRNSDISTANSYHEGIKKPLGIYANDPRKHIYLAEQPKEVSEPTMICMIIQMIQTGQPMETS